MRVEGPSTKAQLDLPEHEMNRFLLVVACVGVLAGVACTLFGCGGGSSPLPVGQVEFPLQASVKTAPFTLREIALEAAWPGDHFEAAGATARIQRPDGTSEALSLDANADGSKLTLGEATVVPSGTTDRISQGTVSADVRLIAEIVTAPNEITSVTLRTRDAGDTLDITGARAHIHRPDNTDERVDMVTNADQTQVTLGPCRPATTSSWWENDLCITGPVAVRDGATGSATEIGAVDFSFDLRPDGHVAIPSTIRVSIPTIGTADDRRVVMEGLAPDRDLVWVAVGEESGAWLCSKLYQADGSGQVIITDTMARVTADRLSGPRSSVWLDFADPDAPMPPPSPRPPIGPPAPPGPGGGDANGEGSNLNVVVVSGPLWLVNGKTGARAQIGRIKFGFEVLADGSVVAPKTLSVSVPVSGTSRTTAVYATGLKQGDFVKTRVVENSGSAIVSPVRQADYTGTVTVHGALRGVNARRLSGPHSSLAFLFARTDADGDGEPDLF
jgi:hypothetical protein